MVLILDPDIEQDAGQPAEYGVEPSGHRIGVDRDRDAGTFGRSPRRFGQRLGLEHLGLRGQPQQRNSGSGRPAGFLTDDQYLPDPLLQSLDPLTDGRRCDMQSLGGRIEAAQLHHRRERGQLLTVQLHPFRLIQRCGREPDTGIPRPSG